jgi:hypothetical protein
MVDGKNFRFFDITGKRMDFGMGPKALRTKYRKNEEY